MRLRVEILPDDPVLVEHLGVNACLAPAHHETVTSATSCVGLPV